MSRIFLERQIAHYMAPVAQGWRQLADAALAELRVSNSSGWCLIYLDRLGPDARQIDLAREIGISQPSLVRTLDQLEAAGLVDRIAHPEDRRSNLLILTPAGKSLVGQIEEKLGTLRHSLLDGLSDGDLETVQRVMSLLTDRIAERRT
ncbi:MarR family transcriptional regulator [Sphingobium sufflavum]|uniref:MarR family winged helix-turn-helix transcriptional regulator n=1 Tax=Sphingobium sufflavum TaxID=1129547 RepID=UPI001F1DEECA|nr:MarR family transcriptional regulator [Sphingobium sufflavum]MCE7796355.1 MarR family transcriptional regulator [Sphingobium sufflavum]